MNEKVAPIARPYTDFQSQLTTTAKNPVQKYMDMQIGVRSWWALLKYEFVMIALQRKSGSDRIFFAKDFLSADFWKDRAECDLWKEHYDPSSAQNPDRRQLHC